MIRERSELFMNLFDQVGKIVDAMNDTEWCKYREFSKIGENTDEETKSLLKNLNHLENYVEQMKYQISETEREIVEKNRKTYDILSVAKLQKALHAGEADGYKIACSTEFGEIEDAVARIENLNNDLNLALDEISKKFPQVRKLFVKDGELL